MHHVADYFHFIYGNFKFLSHIKNSHQPYNKSDLQ